MNHIPAMHYVPTMLKGIADFFSFMLDNEERRLYYVVPIDPRAPYAYQHSSIRDVATICDILDLVDFFEKEHIPLERDVQNCFLEGAKNTLDAYNNLYQSGAFLDLEEANIGDIGFFLLALQKYQKIEPLNAEYSKTKIQLVKKLLERQRPDGSFKIFFNKNLERYEKESEAFYLPEALIGLCAILESDDVVEKCLQKAFGYMCQEHVRKKNIESETVTFYANWQFQLLYHWLASRSLEERKRMVIEKNHLFALINALKEADIATIPYTSGVATVEVACFLEGLVHAQHCCNMLGITQDAQRLWFEEEINRSLVFLYEVQKKHLDRIHGGFVHSLNAMEARVDVTGHVFSGLQALRPCF